MQEGKEEAGKSQHHPLSRRARTSGYLGTPQESACPLGTSVAPGTANLRLQSGAWGVEAGQGLLAELEDADLKEPVRPSRGAPWLPNACEAPCASPPAQAQRVAHRGWSPAVLYTRMKSG